MAMMTGTTILPDDPEWLVPKSELFSIEAACAVGRDACVFAAQLEGDVHDLSDHYSRVYRYDQGRWVASDVDATISDIALYRGRGWHKSGLAVLGLHGDVWLVGETTEHERLPGADIIEHRQGVPFGWVSRIKVHDDELFVSGMDGEFFRRRDGSWRHDDDGMYLVVPDGPRKRRYEKCEAAWIRDILVLANGDCYAVGTIDVARPALFWRPSGSRWTAVALDHIGADYAYMRLECMLADRDGTVWITTSKGVLLKGDGRTGFRIATDVAYAIDSGRRLSRRVAFLRLVAFSGAIYAGGDDGLFRLSDEGRWEAVTGPPAYSLDQSEAGGAAIPARFLDVADDMLWAFGQRGISRFDGDRWDRVAIPPIYKTSE